MRSVFRIVFITSIFILLVNTSGEVNENDFVTIPKESYAVYSLSIYSDTTSIILDVSVISGNNISIYLMDEYNYNIWLVGDRAEPLINEQNIYAGIFEEELSEGNYYVIIDNSRSLDEVEVKILMYEPTTDSNIFGGYGTFILILIVFSFIVVIIKNRKNKNIYKQQIYPQHSYQPVYLPTNTCRNCQNEYHPGSNFCQICGNRVN